MEILINFFHGYFIFILLIFKIFNPFNENFPITPCLYLTFSSMLFYENKKGKKEKKGCLRILGVMHFFLVKMNYGTYSFLSR